MKIATNHSCKNEFSIRQKFATIWQFGLKPKTFKTFSKSSISIPHLTFVILLSSLCFLPFISSTPETNHFQAKPSLDPDENIGKGIDQWPRSEGESSSESNSTGVVNLGESNGSQEIDHVTNSTTPTNSSQSLVNEDEEEDWRDENETRRSHTRVAAVAVYASVILIALFGVLIKYFVTQYETLQAKAQLEYQQLRNVRSH